MLPSSANAPHPVPAAGPDAADDSHTAPLGATGWRVWQSALLRAAGFPAGGLDGMRAADAADAADAVLDRPGAASEAAFEAAFETATARLSRAAHALANDPLFREALIWQNPESVRTMLDPLRASGPSGPRNSSRRQKETAVARYWSRYCAKNDTIGFFGPVCWVRVGGEVPGMVSAPGPALVRSRHVYLERWALNAFADRLAADPEIRRLLPVVLQPTLTLLGDDLLHPVRGAIRCSRAEAAVLSVCDGRSALDVARAAASDPASGIRRAQDAYLVLSSLDERELVVWGVDLPIGLRAENELHKILEALPDPRIRDQARAGLAELTDARDTVAAAAGDPVRLAEAMQALATAFTQATGLPPSHAPGRMYAGRTVCFEDTVRDLDVVVGQNVLDAIAQPLELLLISARWLSTALADRYAEEARSLYDELAEEYGDRPVPFTELMFLIQGLFYGPDRKPVDDVSDEFVQRWSGLLGLDTEAREVHLRSSDLAERVARVFAADAPAWGGARFHSPDLHLIGDPEAMARGEVTAVLGELHAAWNTLDSDFFIARHPDPGALAAGLERDLSPHRVVVLPPEDWPRITARTSMGMRLPGDAQLAWVPAPGPDRDRLLPATNLTVEPSADGRDLVVRAADGRAWPLIEVFATLLASCAVDAFKVFGSFRHSPRVSIDRLVVNRESWSRTAGELGFTALDDERARYLAARRWRRELGLPERVFVKLATEVKPIYVDFTSPLFIRVLSMAVRAGLRDGGPDTPVTITEMLPTPEQAWVPDSAGNTYASELRLLIVDPQRSRLETAVPPR